MNRNLFLWTSVVNHHNNFANLLGLLPVDWIKFYPSWLICNNLMSGINVIHFWAYYMENQPVFLLTLYIFGSGGHLFKIHIQSFTYTAENKVINKRTKRNYNFGCEIHAATYLLLILLFYYEIAGVGLVLNFRHTRLW